MSNSTIRPIAIYPWETALSGVGCTLVGLFGLLSNTISIYAISSNKKLHTPCFVLLAAHAACSLLMSASFINDGVHRAGLSWNLVSIEYPRLHCYLICIPKTASVASSAVLTCLIGLDRLYGIARPVEYHKGKGRVAAVASLILVGILASGNIIAAGLSIPTERMYEHIQCYNSFSAVNSNFVKYYTYHNLGFCILAVCIYAAINLIVRRRYLKKAGNLKSSCMSGLTKKEKATDFRPSEGRDSIFRISDGRNSIFRMLDGRNSISRALAGNSNGTILEMTQTSSRILQASTGTPADPIPNTAPNSNSNLKLTTLTEEDSTRSAVDRLLQSQLSILPMIQTLMISYIFCGVLPEILASVFAAIENGVYQPKVILYSSILKATSGCSDFFILATKSSEFKRTVKAMLKWKSEGGGGSERKSGVDGVK